MDLHKEYKGHPGFYHLVIVLEMVSMTFDLHIQWQ